MSKKPKEIHTDKYHSLIQLTPKVREKLIRQADEIRFPIHVEKHADKWKVSNSDGEHITIIYLDYESKWQTNQK